MSTETARSVERRMKEALKYVKAQWGNGWQRLGPSLQEALIRAEILGEINRLDGAGTDPVSYRTLVEALATAAMQWEGE